MRTFALSFLFFFACSQLAVFAGTLRFGAGGREENLSNLQSANISWTRVPNDVRSSDIESGEPKQALRDMFDIRVREAQEKGCNVYAILTPKSESGSFPSSADFASVLEFFVERYDNDGIDDMPGLLDSVLYWEIVNEYQSSAPEWSAFPQATYVEYCQQSYAALKSANPDAKFSAGSLVCGDMHDFSDFKAVWTAGVAVDFISYHSYLPDLLGMKDATEDLWGFDGDLETVPFVVTESAFYDNPDGVSASQYKNARWLPVACSNAFSYNAERIIYAEMTANAMWSDERLLWMTMIDKDGVKRPNYYTFLRMNQMIGAFYSLGKISDSGADYSAFQYMCPDFSTVFLAWTDEAGGTTISVPGIETRKVRIVCAVPDLDASDDVLLDSFGNPSFDSQTAIKGIGDFQFASASDVPYYIVPVPGNLSADFNADGKSDIICLEDFRNGWIYLMNGTTVSSSGKFYETNDGNWAVFRICDLNGDGKSDLLWKNRSNGKSLVYLMNGTAILSSSSLNSANSGWSVKETGDFNADGKTDILWEHRSGAGHLNLMDGATVLQGADIYSRSSNWDIIAVSDFDGDGKDDLLWENSTGQGYMYLMDGTSIKSAGTVYRRNSSWNIVQFCDFNGDGKQDLLWEHSDGSGYIYLMDGLNVSSGGFAYRKSDEDWEVTRLADFNGDGKCDLLWEHKNGTGAIYLMNGITVSSASMVYNKKDRNWEIAACSDFNGDSKDDLLWENQSSRKTLIYLMNGAAVSTCGAVYSDGMDWRLLMPLK